MLILLFAFCVFDLQDSGQICLSVVFRFVFSVHDLLTCFGGGFFQPNAINLGHLCFQFMPAVNLQKKIFYRLD